MTINLDNWQPFKIGDLFQITRGKRIVHDRDYFDDKTEKFKYSVITCTNLNNSVDGYYYRFNCDGNSLISCGEVSGMFTTYQKNPCWVLDTCRIYKPKNFKINENIAMFLIPIFNKNQIKYSYGRKAKPKDISELTILLPATNDNRPDWFWMDKFIKELKKEEFKKIESGLQNNINQNSNSF